MKPLRETVRALPSDTTVCGWCAEFEARAELALEALREIVRGGHDFRCEGTSSCTCQSGIAERALLRLVITPVQAAQPEMFEASDAKEAADG